MAYKDIDKFGEDGAWCKEGDWVCIGRYAGSRFQIEGGEVRIINDDEVIATIVDPDDIKSYGENKIVCKKKKRKVEEEEEEGQEIVIRGENG